MNDTPEDGNGCHPPLRRVARNGAPGMTFEEFEKLARLHVVGALEDGEEEAFQEAMLDFGERAERLIAEFRQLNSVFALSLRPHPPHPDTKSKLLKAIRESMRESDES